MLLSLLCPFTVNFLLEKASQGGSNQPGVCPLCGTAVRQARNLRRHLLVSCKYRIAQQQANTSSENRTLGALEEDESRESGCSENQDSSASKNFEHIVIKEEVASVDCRSILDLVEPEEIVCRPHIIPEDLLAESKKNE